MRFIALLLAIGVYYLVLHMDKDNDTVQTGGGVIIGLLATYSLSSVFHFSWFVTILTFLGISFAAPASMHEIRYRVGRKAFFRSRGRTFGLTAEQAEEAYFKAARKAAARGEPYESVDYAAWFGRK